VSSSSVGGLWPVSPRSLVRCGHTPVRGRGQGSTVGRPAAAGLALTPAPNGAESSHRGTGLINQLTTQDTSRAWLGRRHRTHRRLLGGAAGHRARQKPRRLSGLADVRATRAWTPTLGPFSANPDHLREPLRKHVTDPVLLDAMVGVLCTYTSPSAAPRRANHPPAHCSAICATIPLTRARPRRCRHTPTSRGWCSTSSGGYRPRWCCLVAPCTNETVVPRRGRRSRPQRNGQLLL
jgi:hypothetical protein